MLEQLITFCSSYRKTVKNTKKTNLLILTEDRIIIYLNTKKTNLLILIEDRIYGSSDRYLCNLCLVTEVVTQIHYYSLVSVFNSF